MRAEIFFTRWYLVAEGLIPRIFFHVGSTHSIFHRPGGRPAGPNLILLSKLRSVVGGPVEECPCPRSGDLGDCGYNERGLADCRRPGVEQHIHDTRRHDPSPLTPRLVWRHLFDSQRTAENVTNYGHLLELAQGLR